MKLTPVLYECVGHFDEPQCQQVRPVDCIPKDPSYQETHQELMNKFQRLQDNAGTS